MAAWTRDWTTGQLEVWRKEDGPLASVHAKKRGKNAVRVLEIGCYEGRSTAAFVELFCGENEASSIVTVDHFDSADMTAAGLARYNRVPKSARVEIWPAFSADAMHELKRAEARFDLAYIDGSHHRLETMDDAVAAWRCLEDQGCLIFDDYEWDREEPDGMDHPRAAIDAFVKLVEPESQVVWRGYQLILKKTSGEPRHALRHPHSENFVIVVVTDDAYSCAAAVAIKSVVSTCSDPGKLAFVVVADRRRLSQRSREGLVSLAPKLFFLDGPEALHPTWARLFLDELIPTDATILYLDADVLCRRDVLELRDYAEVTKFAAVVDFGVPGQFNAGVMLINLGWMRRRCGPKLRARMGEFENDQEVLNAELHIWTPLPHAWNAQGLGTYAQYRTRSEPGSPQILSEKALDTLTREPYIVHFTGSAQFSLYQHARDSARSPCKPWVAGCAHPFRQEWLDVLELTPFECPACSVVTDVLNEALNCVVETGVKLPADQNDLMLRVRQALAPQHHEAPYVGVILMLRCSHEFPPRKWTKQLRRCFEQVPAAKVYIGVDQEDELWRSQHEREAHDGLADLPFAVHYFFRSEPAAICRIWASLARKAVDDGCSYVVLWGDDVSVEPAATWFRHVEAKLPSTEFGCVAPRDASDPSLPTFPIVTKRHFEIFPSLFPPDFVNQDADPYLFELWRRFGRASILEEMCVTNERGGPASCSKATSPPRYDRAPLSDWKDRLLEPNVKEVPFQRVVTIDVVIPTFRTPIDNLRKAVSCRVQNADLKFIIIVDNPANAHDVRQLEAPNVRVRVNESNLGAPLSRNRGLAESCGEWVLFVDDDVELTEACLQAYVDCIERDGHRYAGFVGTTELPVSRNILHEGTRMSDITFFFNLPEWLGDEVPWGVTANLLIKRTSAVNFDKIFAKTGGGEDLDFCVRQTRHVKLPLGRARKAVVVHEWWDDASTRRYVRHFWKWTTGDGYLFDTQPDLVYWNFPNVVEWSFVAMFFFPFAPVSCLLVIGKLWLVEVCCETIRALRGPESAHLPAPRRFAAALVSCVIKNVVDCGHAAFHIRRGHLLRLTFRFDWFCGLAKHQGIYAERRKFAFRNIFWALSLVFTMLDVAHGKPPQRAGLVDATQCSLRDSP